jgi:hypothetical protein
MSFTSFLKAVGNDFKKALPIALKVAQVADIGISVANPALGGIIGTSIQTVLNIEQKAQAIVAAGGTTSGTQKLNEAVNTLYPAFQQLFGQYGVQIDSSHVTAYVNAIVAALNAFPAIPAPPTQATKTLLPGVPSLIAPVVVKSAAPPVPAPAPVVSQQAGTTPQTGGPDPILSTAG